MPPVVASRWRVGRHLGSGQFGDVFEAQTSSGKLYAVKREQCSHRGELEHEAEVYRAVHAHGPAIGFPQIHHFGYTDEGRGIMVLDLLGENLESTARTVGGSLCGDMLLCVAAQLIARLEHLHDAGYLHRDIKPDNIAVGREADEGLVFLLDLGSATPLTTNSCNAGGRRERALYRIYASMAEHEGQTLGRKDDLESMAYALASLGTGLLPWAGETAICPVQLTRRLAMAKRDVEMRTLFRGMPRAFGRFLREVDELKTDERPDYLRMQNIFVDALDQ